MAGRVPIVLLKQFALWLNACLMCPPVTAAQLNGQVFDPYGTPAHNAVVTATPLSGPAIHAQTPAQTLAIMDQRRREFVPHVLVVQQGTAVSFPNSDSIQHHVYSVSKGNAFEIKLYRGVPAQPVRFTEPGIVILGCNIHDWMVGYIYVTDAPLHTISDTTGQWSLDLAPGDYSITIWHPDFARNAVGISQNVKITGQTTPALAHRLPLKFSGGSGKPPTSLQEQAYHDDP